MYTSSVWLRVIKQRVLQQKEKYFYSRAATVGNNIQSPAWPQHWIKFFYRLDLDEARELYLIWILLIKLKVCRQSNTQRAVCNSWRIMEKIFRVLFCAASERRWHHPHHQPRVQRPTLEFGANCEPANCTPPTVARQVSFKSRKLNENPENERADRLNGYKKLFSSNGISVMRKPFGSHIDERETSCENISTILFQFFELSREREVFSMKPHVKFQLISDSCSVNGPEAVPIHNHQLPLAFIW